jgi:DNA-binding transcriptional LysR family regulator
VSQQLQALERIAGVKLATRSPGARSVELTEAGTRLLAHAGAIAGHLEAARADLAACSDGRSGELRIGAVPSAAAALVPGVAAELRTHAPGMTLSVTESYFPAELLDRLAEGALDLVVAPEDEPREALVSETIMLDAYVLLVPAGDPLTRLGRPLTPSDLARRDLIGKDCGTASQRALSAALSDYGLGNPRIRAHDLREVQALVRRGLGVAIVPALLLDGPDPAIDRLPVGHFIPDRRICLTTRCHPAPGAATETTAAIIRRLFA